MQQLTETLHSLIQDWIDDGETLTADFIRNALHVFEVQSGKQVQVVEKTNA